MKKVIKGDFEYLKHKRQRVIALTIIYFAISLGIILIGYITTGTKRNLLTVVGILGCLPACKSMVSMIMYLKAKGCSQKAYEVINEKAINFIPMYDMYFTSYSKNFAVSSMLVKDSRVIGFSEDENLDTKECVNHITTMLKQAGFKDVVVSITDSLEKYLNMLDNVSNEGVDSALQEHDDSIRIALYEISL